MRAVIFILAFALLMSRDTFLTCRVAFAQRKNGLTEKKVPSTELYFDILATGRGTAIPAQRWGRIASALGVDWRVSNPVLGQKLEVKEQRFGTIRRVTVVGRLDARGVLIFADRAFTEQDTEKLAEWINELKTYGAQGTPDGQPAFGLSRAQFDELYRVLGEPMPTEIQNMDLTTALAVMAVPSKFPVRLSTASKDWLAEHMKDRKVDQSFGTMSKGSVLSIMLNNFGLGFRPLRTPDGTIELAVEPLTKIQRHWPIGWDLVKSRLETAPDLFKLVSINLNNLPLKDVLEGVAVAANVPILIDTTALAEANIDLAQITVTYPPKKASWKQFVRTVTTTNRMTHELFIDESGRPFVWITTRNALLRQKDAFAKPDKTK